MNKFFLLFISVFLCANTHSQTTYKIGVNLFREEKGPVATQAITGKVLDSIVASITANRPERKSTDKKVKLVISMDVPWQETETTPHTYNFEWYKSFATLCEQKGISWTPLLAPHYVPDFILSDPVYQQHQLCYVDGSPLNEFLFLPLSPSSSIWKNEIADWIKAFINAMVDSNHITTDPENPKAIDEFLVGNEMMYPFNKETSGDIITKTRWVEEGNNIEDYPISRQEFVQNWNSIESGKPNPLRDFRNNELMFCITGMISVVKSQLVTRLGFKAASIIGVSSKLVPYQFPREDFGTFFINEFSGYDDQNLEEIIDASNQFVAVDSYTTSTGWKITYDYKATYDRISKTNKAIYLAEFNRNLFQEKTPLTSNDIYNYGVIGFKKYDLKYYVYFAWNPKNVGSIYQITEGQKLGLYNLFNTLVPIDNPIESEVKNNFPSGAYYIPSTYNNASDFSLSRDDVDWYKFVFEQRTYYLKVIQKTGLQSDLKVKSYGLKLSANVFSITAKTYNIGDDPEDEVDTELFLFDENLVQLAYNDDNDTDKFSALSFPLLKFPFKQFRNYGIQKM